MSEKKKKVYASGLYDPQAKTFERNGEQTSLIKLVFNVDKFVAFLQEHKDEKGLVKVDCWQKDEVGQFGGTHNAVLNDWKPNQQSGGGSDDLPF